MRLLVLGGWCALSVVQPLTAARATGHVPGSGTSPAGSFAVTGTVVTPVPTAAAPVEREPTTAELAQQQAQLARLRAQEKLQVAQVDDAQAALRASAALAGQALEAYSITVRTLATRQSSERAAETTMDQAHQRVDSTRRDLGRWARQAYQGGTGLAASPMLNTLFRARSGDDLGTDRVVLRRIGRDRALALDAVVLARQQADSATDRAADASEAAATAAIAAAAAREDADQALDVQRRLLGVAETALAQTHTDTAVALARQVQLQAAADLTRTRRAAGAAGAGSGATKDNRVTGQVGSCAGGAVEQYPNGQIPVAVLCPLWGAPGYLRADAAFAYDRLSHAYAAQFAVPICLTDAYRTYATQVDLYARKPGLAAMPGTSNHGWGTAVDLCGGIQSFATAQHDWMLINAPLYGWFHPGWAEPGGSRPEPWHWEFGG